MTLPMMPIDGTKLEFRYHGASEYYEYDRETEKRSKDQARDEDTGYPIFNVRCQVLFRAERQAGMIAVRVPLAEPPGDDLDFEHPLAFGDLTAKTWSMDGRDGQTWTAGSMTVMKPSGPPPVPPAPKPKATTGTS